MCQIEPEGYCSVFEDHPVKQARKRYRCDGCHGFIQIGESYVSHFSIFEGDATHEKCCTPCQLARIEFKADHHWMPTPGSMHEFLTECIDAETHYDYMTDEEKVSPAGAKWQAIKDQMVARRDAAQAQVQT